jgi:hypothetical protein
VALLSRALSLVVELAFFAGVWLPLHSTRASSASLDAEPRRQGVGGR